jgi:hypothetical protein
MLAPLACGVVLLVSGWAKRGDATGTRLAFAALRVPRPFDSPSVVAALPYVELGLGVAVLLCWGTLLAVVALVVTLLFVAYAVLVARALASGDQVECHCFGSLGDDRVTAATLARNLVLVVLAVLAVALGAGGSGLAVALADLEGADLWWPLLAVLVALAAVLVVRRAPAEAPADDGVVDYLRQPIPVGVLEREDGTLVPLRRLAARRPQLLLFLSTTCVTCDVVADWVPGWAERLGPVEIVDVFTVPLADLSPRLRPVGATPYRDPDSQVTDLFTDARPTAVLLGADGMLAGGPVVGAREIQQFVEDIVAELDAATVPEPATVHGHDHDHDHGHEHVHVHFQDEPAAPAPGADQA